MLSNAAKIELLMLWTVFVFFLRFLSLVAGVMLDQPMNGWKYVGIEIEITPYKWGADGNTNKNVIFYIYGHQN